MYHCQSPTELNHNYGWVYICAIVYNNDNSVIQHVYVRYKKLLSLCGIDIHTYSSELMTYILMCLKFLMCLVSCVL